MQQIDIEADFSTIEMPRYLSMLDRGGLVGLAGIDRGVVEGINTIQCDLHWAIGNIRETERAVWLDCTDQIAR